MQGQVKFNGFQRRLQEKVPEKVWEALVQSQVSFNKVPEKVPEKVWEAGSGEGLGGFGAEPGFCFQQGSGEGSSAWLRSTLQTDV